MRPAAVHAYCMQHDYANKGSILSAVLSSRQTNGKSVLHNIILRNVSLRSRPMCLYEHEKRTFDSERK